MREIRTRKNSVFGHFSHSATEADPSVKKHYAYKKCILESQYMRVRKYKRHILPNLGQKEGEIFQTA